MSTNTTSTYKIFTDIDLAKNDIFNVSKIIGDNLDTTVNKNLEITTADSTSSTTAGEFGNLIIRAGAKDTTSNVGGNVNIYAGIAETENDKKGAFEVPNRGITLHPDSSIDIIADSTVSGIISATAGKEIVIESPHVIVKANRLDEIAEQSDENIGEIDTTIDALTASITTANVSITTATIVIGDASVDINILDATVTNELEYDSIDTTLAVFYNTINSTTVNARIEETTLSVVFADFDIAHLDYDSTDTTIAVTNANVTVSSTAAIEVTNSASTTIADSTVNITTADVNVSGLLDYDSTSTTVVVKNDRIKVTNSASTTIANITANITTANTTIGTIDTSVDSVTVNITDLNTTVGRAQIDILNNSSELEQGGNAEIKNLDIKTGTGYVRNTTANKAFYTPVAGLATENTEVYSTTDNIHYTSAGTISAGSALDGYFVQRVYPSSTTSLEITTSGAGTTETPFISQINAANGLKISTTTNWADTTKHDPYESYIETHNLKVNNVLQARGFMMYWDNTENSLVFAKGDIFEGEI